MMRSDSSLWSIGRRSGREAQPFVSLNVKATLLLASVLAVFAVLGAVLLRVIFLRSFEDFELRHAKLDLERFAEVLVSERRDLEHVAQALATKLDTGAVSSTDSMSTAIFAAWSGLRHAGAEFLCVYNSTGTLLASQFTSPSATASADDVETSLCDLAVLGAPPQGAETPSIKSGFVEKGGTPLIIASAATDLGASRPGSLAVGRILDSQAMADMSRRIRADVDLWSLASPELALLEGAAGAALSLGQPVVVNDKSADVLHVYTALPDINGAPAFLVRANVRRDLREAAMEKVVVAVGALVLLGATAVVALLLLLRGLVVGPLSRLTSDIVSLKRAGRLSARLDFHRRDEIGVLAEAFNQLLEELAEATRRLSDASYRAGRAEMAEGVLHNIRNVLNSLSVSVHATLNRLKDSRQPRIYDALDEVGRSEGLLERQRHLIEYVRLNFREIEARQTLLADDMRRIEEKAQAIDTILEAQRQFGHGPTLEEPVSIAAVIRDATDLLPEAFRSTCTIRVDDSIPQSPPVLGHQVVVSQILGNLLLNAAESIQRSGKRSGTIELSVAPVSHKDRAMIDILVRDDGLGIPPADLTRVFQRGYSTKGDKGRGIGLHWSANLVAGMHGEIYAESEGLGRGACVHLLLPEAHCGTNR